MKLIQLKENTYYFDSPTKVGLYLNPDNNEVTLIDSGNDKDAGRKILKQLKENNWTLKTIICTHSHADHIGGNAYLQKQTNCRIIAPEIESAFIESPLLEPAYLYGGFPPKQLKNKFLMAKPSVVSTVDTNKEEGFELINLPGHTFNMFGVKTPDNIFFLADSIFPKTILEKYGFAFMTDVKEQLSTLDMIKTLEADFFLPSHGTPIKKEELLELIELNKEKILEAEKKILQICESPKSTEQIFKEVAEHFDIKIVNETIYFLNMNTTKSFLTYLENEGKLTHEFSDSVIRFCAKSQ